MGKQPWIQQFGGQPYHMRRCDGSMLSHPMRDWRYDSEINRGDANKVGLWREIVDRRFLDGIPMRGYEIRSEIQQTQRGQADQRNETEVKGLNNNREMVLDPGAFQPYQSMGLQCPGYRRVDQQEENVNTESSRGYTYGQSDSLTNSRRVEIQSTNTKDDRPRDIPVSFHPGATYLCQNEVSGELQETNNIKENGRMIRESNICPMPELRPPGHEYIERQESNISRHRNENVNVQAPPVEMCHLDGMWRRTDTSSRPGNTITQDGNNGAVFNRDGHYDTLNTAMLEPRQLSRNSGVHTNDLEWGGRRTPHTVGSENLLEQQMGLMREMFQMVSVQNAHMRDQINTRNKLRITPEKFAGTTSFYSFMAQFENCCEINKWEEHEKLLMLRSSLTGNAAAILWELGADKQCSYEELVELLRTRYGSEGQAESFRMQLRTKKQKKGESLNNLAQDIRKLITLSYPGKTSEIVEALARDAFIEALYDRDLALQVLAKEPNTLEKAYQTATKLQSYKELIYSSEPAKSSTYSVERKSSAIQNESKVEGAVKQSKEEMKELTQVIQEMSRKMTQLGEEMEKMKKTITKCNPI